MRNRDLNRSINRPYSFLKALNDNVSGVLVLLLLLLLLLLLSSFDHVAVYFLILGTSNFTNTTPGRWTFVKVI